MDMDIEKLKLVLEMLGGMGTETVALAKLYLGLMLASEALGWAALLVGVWFIVVPSIRALSSMFGAVITLESIRDELNIGSSGELTSWELQAIRKTIIGMRVELQELRQAQEKERTDAKE